jgi:hypothetical protein
MAKEFRIPMQADGGAIVDVVMTPSRFGDTNVVEMHVPEELKGVVMVPKHWFTLKVRKTLAEAFAENNR